MCGAGGVVVDGKENVWRVLSVSDERIWMVGTLDSDERAGDEDVMGRRDVGSGGRTERMNGRANTARERSSIS